MCSGLLNAGVAVFSNKNEPIFKWGTFYFIESALYRGWIPTSLFLKATIFIIAIFPRFWPSEMGERLHFGFQGPIRIRLKKPTVRWLGYRFHGCSRKAKFSHQYLQNRPLNKISAYRIVWFNLIFGCSSEIAAKLNINVTGTSVKLLFWYHKLWDFLCFITIPGVSRGLFRQFRRPICED